MFSFEYFFIFIIVGFVIRLFLSPVISFSINVLISLVWAVIFGSWAIAAFIELMIGWGVVQAVQRLKDSQVLPSDIEKSNLDFTAMEDNHAIDYDWQYAKIMAQYKELYQLTTSIRTQLPGYDSEASEKQYALNYYRNLQQLDEEEKNKLYEMIDNSIDERYRRETGQLTFMDRLKDLWEMVLDLVGLAIFGLLIYAFFSNI